MKNNWTKYIFYTCLLTGLISCKKFLDIVPDNVATIDYAFRNRQEAEKYLFTCYNSLPDFAQLGGNPGLLGSDELTTNYPGYTAYGDIAGALTGIRLGQMNKVNPLANFWDGGNSGKPYFQALRECNIFLENIGLVPDLSEFERDRWIAEVKFLKAYYHYWLFRMYGPIPLIKNNLPVSASVDEVRILRQPVDSVVNYISSLLDEAISNLPAVLMNETEELGRISRPIALSVKAELLVTAASPLFNGNTDYAGLKNKDGVVLFNATYSVEKWQKAATACKAAIVSSEASGAKLYKFIPRSGTFVLSDTTMRQMDIRGAITEKWNSEVIWGGSFTDADSRGLQANAQCYLSPTGSTSSIGQNLNVPLSITEMFYSSNGVPIDEDLAYDYANRFSLVRIAGPEHRFYIKKDYITAQINFDREPRYYADLGFDGAIWYGSGRNDDNNPFWVEAKLRQVAGSGVGGTNYGVSGIWPKKLVNPSNAYTAKSYTIEPYPWPIIRLADMYLLYAEALNEVNGPAAEVYDYINRVRTRAGLTGVIEAWALYSRQPSKPGTKNGLREIIQRERMIETAFEGKRFWDIRRWKTASALLNQPVTGWGIAATESAEYYRPRVIYTTNFSLKDYFWPISENSMVVNPNLVQNLGW